jgi:hypothetical protein
MNKKSQAWSMDLIIGIMIFSAGILVFFIYTINNSASESQNIENIKYNGDSIINSILSEGYPVSWNTNTVFKIGILDNNNKINQTKLEYFYNLSLYNYTYTKHLFNTNFDYYLFFDNLKIYSISKEGFGKPGANSTNINATNLIKISRVTIYNNTITTINLYVWE